MDLTDARDYWESLETGDKVKLGAMLALALALLVPWRKHLVSPVLVLPRDQDLVLLLAPGPGLVREVPALRGKVLEAGEVVYTYLPQGEAANPAPQAPWSPQVASFNPLLEDEQRIRDRYRRQLEDANAIIRSNQDQLNRIYQESSWPRGNSAYEAQLAQNALARAQEAPRELNRKMEQELAAQRAQRDTYLRASQPTQAVRYLQPVQPSQAPADPATGEIAVTASERALLWSCNLARGSRVVQGQRCGQLLPEGAAFQVSAALPAALAQDLREGMPATLELVAWMHDAERVGLRLEKVGNRPLEREELATLLPDAVKGVPYLLVTFRAEPGEPRLFPPPRNCRLHLTGLARCWLRRFWG